MNSRWRWRKKMKSSSFFTFFYKKSRWKALYKVYFSHWNWFIHSKGQKCFMADVADKYNRCYRWVHRVLQATGVASSPMYSFWPCALGNKVVPKVSHHVLAIPPCGSNEFPWCVGGLILTGWQSTINFLDASNDNFSNTSIY